MYGPSDLEQPEVEQDLDLPDSCSWTEIARLCDDLHPHRQPP